MALIPGSKIKETPVNEYFQVSGDNLAAVPPMVKIFVGPDRKQWVLPEQLLCDRVEYFKSAFQSGFRESNEKVLELPEDCPVAFAYIIDSLLGPFNPPTENFGESQDDRQMTWFKVYVLADKLGCSGLVFAVHHCREEIWDLSNASWAQGEEFAIVSPAAAKFLYDNTTDGDDMRQCLAEFLAHRQLVKPLMEASQLERWLESATSHPKFLFDVMEEIGLHYKIPLDECVLNDCAFHEM